MVSILPPFGLPWDLFLHPGKYLLTSLCHAIKLSPTSGLFPTFTGDTQMVIHTRTSSDVFASGAYPAPDEQGFDARDLVGRAFAFSDGASLAVTPTSGTHDFILHFTTADGDVWRYGMDGTGFFSGYFPAEIAPVVRSYFGELRSQIG